MREIVAEDNVSAGKGALLTADVVSHLAWIGKTVGPVLDEVRKSLHLAELRKVSADIARIGQLVTYLSKDRSSLTCRFDMLCNICISTRSTQEACARSCSFYGAHAAT